MRMRYGSVMIRSTLFLALLATMAMVSQAQAGDIIVVEEPTPAAQAAAFPDDIKPEDRTMFQKLVAQGCYQKGRWEQGFKDASARTGKNAAEIYCDCISPHMAAGINRENVMVMFKTRALPPELKQSLLPHVRQCLAQAGYQHQ